MTKSVKESGPVSPKKRNQKPGSRKKSRPSAKLPTAAKKVFGRRKKIVKARKGSRKTAQTAPKSRLKTPSRGKSKGANINKRISLKSPKKADEAKGKIKSIIPSTKGNKRPKTAKTSPKKSSEISKKPRRRKRKLPPSDSKDLIEVLTEQSIAPSPKRRKKQVAPASNHQQRRSKKRTKNDKVENHSEAEKVKISLSSSKSDPFVLDEAFDKNTDDKNRQHGVWILKYEPNSKDYATRKPSIPTVARSWLQPKAFTA